MTEEELLLIALEADRQRSKDLRRSIKDPHKLCDRCMNEHTTQTPDALMLCNECSQEYINELKTTVG